MRITITIALCALLGLTATARAEEPMPADFSTWVSESLRLRSEAGTLHDSATADRAAGHITAFCREIRQEADDMNQAADYSDKILAVAEAHPSPDLATYQKLKADNDAWAADANASVADCAQATYMEDGTLHHGDNVMSPEWQRVYDGDLAEYSRLIASASENAIGAQQAIDGGYDVCPYLKVIVYAADQANMAADGVRSALKAAGMPTDSIDDNVTSNNTKLQPYRDRYSSACR